jgi:hypothetical protein
MHVTQPPPIDSSAPRFDKLSFANYVKNIGRDYREQAIKLVSFCRVFAQAQKQTRSSYEELRRYYSQIMPILRPVSLFRKYATGR